jgi:AcrR family transcriptional regulator
MSEQRNRLVAATALAMACEQTPTVASIVKLAGVSRNTFYEFFDDVEHARAAGKVRSQQRLEHALRAAEQRSRTPVERWRALAQAWLDWALDWPVEASLILQGGTAALSAAGRELEGALARSIVTLRASGLVVAGDSASHVTAVAAAGEVFARKLVAKQMTKVEWESGATARDALERAIVDIAVRLLH